MNSLKKSSTLDLTSSESKPLSAWERRKLYSKQMYDKQRVNKNSENRTAWSKIDSGKPYNPSVATVKSKAAKRKLSLVEDQNAEKQLGEKFKSAASRVPHVPQKRSPKQKWQGCSDGKENSEPKKSSESSFPVCETSKQHSVSMIVSQDCKQPSPKLLRSASFTIDKENKSIEETSVMQTSGGTQGTLSGKKELTKTNVAIVESTPSQKNKGSSKPKKCSAKKSQLHRKAPLKSGRRAVKEEGFVKPDNFSQKGKSQREKLVTWQHQQNKSASRNNRRLTCAPAVLRTIEKQDVKQVSSNVKLVKNRRTLSSIDILKKGKRMQNSAKFTVISAKLQGQDKNSRLSVSHGKKVEPNTRPLNDRFSLNPHRSHAPNLARSTVAANLERSLADKNVLVGGQEKSTSKSDKIRKNTDTSVRKRKSTSAHSSENETDNRDSENSRSCSIDTEQNEATKLKHNLVVEQESTADEKTESKEADCEKQVANKVAASHTSCITSSRKKSVCFDVPLHGSTPGRTLPKTPKRDLTLRERLQQWLDNKGHSVSSFRHVKCFGYHLSNMKPKKNLRRSRGNTENTPSKEGSSLFGESPVLRTRESKELCSSALLDGSFDIGEVLAELKILLAKGHPTNDITEWLDELVKYVPSVEENPQYWICRSLVEELSGEIMNAIGFYEKALDKTDAKERNKDATYTAEICKAIKGLLCRYKENFNKNTDHTQTPQRKKRQTLDSFQEAPREPLTDRKNAFNSTVIKYGLAYNTLGLYKSSAKAVVTPVRRSTRLSCTPGVKASQVDTVFESLSDLPQNIKDDVLFRENTALILD